MRTLSLSLGLSCGLLLSACGGSSKPAEAPAPDPAPVPTAAETQATRCRALIDKTLSMQNGDAMFAQLPEDKRAGLRTRFVDGLVAACSEDAWPEEMLACGEKAADGEALDACGKLLDEGRQEKAAKRVEPVMKDMMAAMPAEPTPPPAPEPANREPSGVAECDQYMLVFDAYIACDKVPQAARDASKQAVNAMYQAWSTLRDPKTPPEAKRQAGDACLQATEALTQSAQALGCDVTAFPKAKAAEPEKPAKGKKPAKKPKAKK